MTTPTKIRLIADLGTLCPELGLVVHRDSKWHYRAADSDYKHCFAVVGTNILVSEPHGSPDLKDLEHVLDKMQQTMAQRLGPGQKFVHVSNFTFTRAASVELRRHFIQHFQNNDLVAGLVFFNVSPFNRLSIKLARRLKVIPFKVFIVSSYADAMQQARQLLAGPTDAPVAPEAERAEPPPSKDAAVRGNRWEFVFDDDYAIRFEASEPGLLEAAPRGVLHESHVAGVFDHHDEIFPQCGLEDGNYYYISNVSALRRASLKARRLYYDHIRAWYERHPFRAYVFYGVNPFIRAAINVARHFVSFEVVIARDREEALDFVRRAEAQRSARATQAPTGATMPTDTERHAPADHVEELLYYLGQVSWDAEAPDRAANTRPDHPLRPVFEAIDLVKNDFDETIAERNDALAELQERNAFIEAVAGSLPVGLLVSRMESGQLIYANSRFDEIYGQRLEAGDTLDRFIETALGRPELTATLPRAGNPLAKAGQHRVEWTDMPLTTADGGQRHVTLVTVPLIAQRLFITTLMDVSDRVHMQSEKVKLQADLFQAQKMEAIGTLAGGIAHDFNNVLAAIMGFVEMALIDLPDADPVRDNLDQVLKASHRARELVKQILAFSRKDVGLHKEQLLEPIVEESLNLIRASLPTSVAIDKQLDAPEGVANADATQIQQVLLNLCANAAHAMEEQGGVLKIRLKAEQVDESRAASIPHIEPGPYLRLTVADTGKGMPPDVLQRIFEPFFTTKEMGKGTGMGLSVVHGIVRAHGGAIAANSTPGQGSRFDIYLPKASVSDRQPAAEQQAAIVGGNEHILFVDDEVMLTDIGRQMLQRLGYQVTTRTSSIEALEAFRARPNDFDLVISDMTMPNLTGDRLARSLLAIRDDIPVILCTGFSALLETTRAREMGVRAYLSKPLSIRELARTVRTVLDSDPPE
ncbi:MAG: ATP-binding protein [Desulfobacterales bacterium]|nr:ATP-binding protein [Desulfobacterales bacterium]